MASDLASHLAQETRKLMGPENAKGKCVAIQPSNPIEPNHYKVGGIEAISVIEAWKLGFCLGNCIKYIQRHTLKNGLEDLKKARWYLDRAISQMEKQAENPQS
jgi:hypothetical protein